MLSGATLAFELSTWISVLCISASFHYGGAVGLAAWTALVHVPLVMVDWYISPTMERNLRNLAENGYPRPAMWALIALNLVTTNTLVAVITDTFGCFEAAPRFDWVVALGLVVNLALSELTFTAGHYLLHRTELGAKFHHLHHCCRPPSISTNLLFHPVDMAVEFSGPVLSLVATHLLIFKEPFLLLLSIHVLHFWYSLDHSENVQLYHYTHHMRVDSVYSIYAKIRFSGEGEGRADKVKPLLAATRSTAGSRDINNKNL